MCWFSSLRRPTDRPLLFIERCRVLTLLMPTGCRHLFNIFVKSRHKTTVHVLFIGQLFKLLFGPLKSTRLTYCAFEGWLVWTLFWRVDVPSWGGQPSTDSYSEETTASKTAPNSEGPVGLWKWRGESFRTYSIAIPRSLSSPFPLENNRIITSPPQTWFISISYDKKKKTMNCICLC